MYFFSEFNVLLLINSIVVLLRYDLLTFRLVSLVVVGVVDDVDHLC